MSEEYTELSESDEDLMSWQLKVFGQIPSFVLGFMEQLDTVSIQFQFGLNII